MARGKYSDHVKTAVVQRIACFDPPSVVVKAIKADLGIDISPQAVEAYDPNKKAGAKLAERWRLLFAETRKAFLENTAEIGISHRAVRLRALERMAKMAEEQRNMVLAAQLLEQAAKEMGNAYTNRHELTGKDGKDLPAPASPVAIFQLPDNGRS